MYYKYACTVCVHVYAYVGRYTINYVCMLHACMYVYTYAKQKHLGCKKVRGQSEATLQTGRRDQKV